MSTQVKCPCGNEWQVDDSLAGKRILCSACSRRVPVPEKQVMPAAGFLEFACEGCGKNLRLKEELAGRRIKCPDCEFVQTAPSPEPLAEPEEADEGLAALRQRLERQKRAAQKAKPTKQRPTSPTVEPTKDSGDETVSIEFQPGGLDSTMRVLRVPIAGRLIIRVGKDTHELEAPMEWKKLNPGMIMMAIDMHFMRKGIALPSQAIGQLQRFIEAKRASGLL